MSKISYFTEEGLSKLKNELRLLKTSGRKKIAQQIADARDKGDLSENAEYDAAKEAQGLHELKISKLESTLSNAKIIDKKNIDASKVSILSKVDIKYLQNDMKFTYQLVAEEESDLKSGKLSVKSPIGSSLLGKRKGDIHYELWAVYTHPKRSILKNIENACDTLTEIGYKNNKKALKIRDLVKKGKIKILGLDDAGFREKK